MEKKDLIYFIAAVGVVVVLAFIVKPALTGESITLWGGDDNQTAIQGNSEDITAPSPTQTPTATMTPTPTPTWDGTSQSVSFVNPSTYGIDLNSTANYAIVPPEMQEPGNVTMEDYRTISASGSGATEIVSIPFPYWDMTYDISVYNLEYAEFELTVKDAADPNREIWQIGLFGHDLAANTDESENFINTVRIYEGYRDYYFVIRTQVISSYSITIKVPNEYAT